MAERFAHQGVEALRVGRYDLGISSSCIVYRIGSTVIDTGPPNQWSVVRSFLHERDVGSVLVTHHHEDHSGNAGRLARESDAPVYVPEPGMELVARGFTLRPYQRIIWGVPLRFDPHPMPDELFLEDGMRLTAVFTPGHSSDSTCYLEPNRGWLFSGDLFISSKPRFCRADENVHEEIESLSRVLDLDFGTLFCAHRGVVADGTAAVRAKLEYLTSLRDEVRHLHGEGRSPREITRLLLGKEQLLSYLTLFHFSKRNLVKGLLRDPYS